jgi:DNA polymerase I-like protein with 3'-5' exonuclease and polymerase domains/predicted P-loop ATPase
MDIADITPENVAKAVGGTLERNRRNIICRCPVHETNGSHNPSLVLTITDARRIIFHCRSQRCDDKHFRTICNHLVEKCGLPRSHVGGNRAVQDEIHYAYHHADGAYSWTKIKYFTPGGKKRFVIKTWQESTEQWTTGRPKDAVLLYNLTTIKHVVGQGPAMPLLIVEGEKDVSTAGDLGVLATTSADGASSWRVEDTQTLINLGVTKVVVCPDNDGPGIEHGIRVAKTFTQTGVEVKWLELEGAKDLSEWAPNQAQPDALLKELIDAAPLFDAEALDWRSKLKMAGRNAGHTYRGDIYNMSLALRHEPHLKSCFVWNDFRHQVEVASKTPWCRLEWWTPENLTPIGHRKVRDADYSELGNYLTQTYDLGGCQMAPSRVAVHTVAHRHIFDELKSWRRTFPAWDGVNRSNWLATYAGADTKAHSAEYLTLIGMKFLMQVLNRAFNPGAKADYSLVFTAGQGAFKDSVFETMFAPYYREGIPSPRVSQADFALGLAGAIVAHAAEMSAWRKADVEEQKAALTRRSDYGRRAYDYEFYEYLRRCCLVFSTNDIEFLLDATGNRRYWVVQIIRDRVDIEALRRDRYQILAEALARLEAGELHWPTPEEEERIIDPERQKFMPEAALEILAILERYITEEPKTTRPNRPDFSWKWEPRPQPLGELYLDDFFHQCFGMYTAIKRNGLDRASKRDVSYCTTWLRENGWQRVKKRLPDGQRVYVWRVSNEKQDRHSGTPSGPPNELKASKSGLATIEETGASNGATASVGDAAGEILPAVHPRNDQVLPENRRIIDTRTALSSRSTQNHPYNDSLSEIFCEEDSSKKIHFWKVREKIVLGGPTGDGVVLPAVAPTPVSMADLDEVFDRSCFLALDVETTGLDATRDGLRTVQFCDGKSAAVVVFDRPVPARALVVLAEFLDGRRVVAHNARFEGSWFHAAGIDLVLDDTVLMFSAVRGTRSLRGGKLVGGGGGRISLASLAMMVLGETLDKSQQTSDWAAAELTDEQLRYALNDAVVTHRVFEALREELHKKSEQHGVDIAAGYEDMRFSAAMAHKMERAGVEFDVEAHAAWIARKLEPVAALEAHLATLDPALTPECIASPVQLDKLFRQRLDLYAPAARRPALLRWPKTEKKRRLAFGREDLAAVLTGVPLMDSERRLVEALYTRAEQVSGLATFGEAFSAHVVDGRLYGQLHAGGTVTGRYTSTDPNLQNIPTDSEFRGFFRAGAGRMLVDADYSQLELRVFAALSSDAEMIQAFEDGWDYHDLIVQRLGCTRRQAKGVNFGIIFGMSAATLAEDIGVDEETAGAYVRGWDEQAPDGARWRASLPRLYAAEQGLRTARRWIDYLDDEEADISSSTRPKNYPVQGGAADVMHRAMRLLLERHSDWPGHAKPVLTIHDEILVEADADQADAFGSLLANLMIEAFCDVFPKGPTRFLVIPGIGSTWAAAKADGSEREKALRAAFNNDRQERAACESH